MSLFLQHLNTFKRDVAPPSVFAANTADLNGSSMNFQRGDNYDAGTNDIDLVIRFKGTGTDQSVMAKQNDADANWWLFNLANSGKIRMDLRVDGSNFRVVETTASFNDGSYHLAIIHVDRSAGTISINVDGSAEATTSVSSNGVITGSQNNSSTFMVGRRDSTSQQFFNGEIGFVGVAFSTDLTADSAELYNSGVAKCWSDLSAPLQAKFTSNGGEFWELANWTDHTAQELVGQANSGTYTNVTAS
ncbi:MAG TPA: hypothetical protein EYN51_03045, partial [Flavobacteriales bacterium]|nr:hypothetical protein [Flavobacteriales bacterium]